MKRFILIALALTLPILTAACNTMEGVGQDVQNGGHKIEREADEHKDRD